MKNLRKTVTTALGLIFMSTLLVNCVTVTDQGPRGRDGKVYFGIDYDYNPPYSYWDNNFEIPNNPVLGHMYRTSPGIYEFEYFINPYEYWYGTYTLYEDRGGLGGPYGERGADGWDTYLLLICNDNGYYTESWEECGCYRSASDDGEITIDGGTQHTGKFTVKMKKTTVSERPSVNTPKYKK